MIDGSANIYRADIAQGGCQVLRAIESVSVGEQFHGPIA